MFGTATVIGNSFLSPTSIDLYGLAGGATTNSFTGRIFDFIDAYSTTKFKTIKINHGWHVVTNRENGFISALWRSTDAIDSITITANGALSYVSGSRFSLYGIKG
jgi:hypothetical protein